MILYDVGDKGKHGINAAAHLGMLKLENVHELRMNQLDKIARVEHIERPHDNKHEQSDGRLVDFRHAFERNEEVAYDEDYNNSNRECRHFLLLLMLI